MAKQQLPFASQENSYLHQAEMHFVKAESALYEDAFLEQEQECFSLWEAPRKSP